MSIEITAPESSEVRPALELLLVQVPETERAGQLTALLDAAGRGEMSLGGLLVARDAQRLVGAVLAVCQPDGTAHVWVPRVTNDEPISTAEALAAACCRWIGASGAAMAQCLTQLEDYAAQELLERAGFERLTDLACWQHTLEELPNTVLPIDCEAVRYTPGNAALFESVIQETYIGSQDCAALRGRRTARDSLIAHELAANAESRHWLLYRCGDENVGVVLCADHRDQRMWELLYLGVVTKFRQQGFGLAMLGAALWDAQKAGAEGMFLAADDANEAAANLYDACGFTIGFRQRIHIWFPGAAS